MSLSTVNFIRKSWSKSFNNGIVSNRVGLKCIWANTSSHNTELFYKFSTWIWKANGRLQFRENLTHQGTKKSRRENLCFSTRNFRIRQNSTIWNLVFTLPLRILLKPGTLSFKKNTITAKTVSQLKCLEERKKSRFTLQMKDLFLHSLVRIWDTFSEVMLVMNLE